MAKKLSQETYEQILVEIAVVFEEIYNKENEYDYLKAIFPNGRIRSFKKLEKSCRATRKKYNDIAPGFSADWIERFEIKEWNIDCGKITWDANESIIEYGINLSYGAYFRFIESPDGGNENSNYEFDLDQCGGDGFELWNDLHQILHISNKWNKPQVNFEYLVDQLLNPQHSVNQIVRIVSINKEKNQKLFIKKCKQIVKKHKFSFNKDIEFAGNQD